MAQNYSNTNPLQFTYYATHQTANSQESIMICSMEDSHLRATIALLLGQLNQIMSFSGSGLANIDSMSQMILGAMHKNLIREAQNRIPYLLAKINAYMSEAIFIRGMVDLIPEYQKAVGRTGALPFLLLNQDDTIALEGGDR